MFLAVLAESLLLALHPVLVEPSQSVFVQLLTPYSGQCPKASRSVNIAHHSHYSHRGCFNDGHSLHYFLLVVSTALSVYFS